MLTCHLQSKVDKADLSTAVRKALYASKICSYAQGLNIIRAKSISMGWNIEMGELTRIWKVVTLMLLHHLLDLTLQTACRKTLPLLLRSEFFRP